MTYSATGATVVFMRTRRTFAELIRATTEARGLTAYALARDSGVNSAVVGRFLKGQRDVTLTTAEKMCRVLRLELRPQRRRKKGG